ncbi:MAG: M13 family metallopeptidase [Thermoplasmata archaeon]
MAREESLARISTIGDEEKPENPRFSIEFMNRQADPLDNFYEFSTGNWIRTHPIPPDKSSWSSSAELVERNRYILGKILEECASKGYNQGDSVEKMVGDFYISAMDLETIERLKFSPMEKLVNLVDGVNNTSDLISVVSNLHLKGIPCLFSYESSADERNSSIYSLHLVQGGLTLPNRDYYLLDSFADIRNEYVRHLQRMFILYGFSQDSAKESSGTVMRMETRMAEHSRRPAELRDPERNYNRMDTELVRSKFPGLRFDIYFSSIGLPETDYFVEGQPEFFENLESMIQDFSIEDWKIYLKWKILHFSAPYLHDEVEMENFNFFHKTLFGQEVPEKRWKRVVSVIDRHLGEALGKIYVEREFGEDSRKRMSEMIDHLLEVFTERLQNISWMAVETRNSALAKFKRFRAKIGYPSKFIDYSPVQILYDDYLGNIIRSNEFESRRQISRVNSPVDRELWEMTPPTVNAYFSPTGNEIVFPAGILQPPFFDPEMDDAINYGATGGTIAHEITHGFDDEGRKFDAEGNLKEWWTKEDELAFMDKAKDVIELYSSLEALPGLHVNGELTLGENIADIGGVSIAFEALERKLESNPDSRKIIDGLTPEQRFFIGWAQSWRMNIRDQALRWQISNDPHSPDRFRAEIPAMVHEKFEETFANLSALRSTNFKKIRIW